MFVGIYIYVCVYVERERGELGRTCKTKEGRYSGEGFGFSFLN